MSRSCFSVRSQRAHDATVNTDDDADDDADDDTVVDAGADIDDADNDIIINTVVNIANDTTGIVVGGDIADS